MSSAAQLPNETLHTIFENLSPGSLAAVLRASHRFRLVAERILYANIVIIESLHHRAPTPIHTATCANTLLARPHLSEVVRRLSIRWQTDSGPREPFVAAAGPVLDVLHRALQTLVHLEHLDLALGLAGGTLDARAVLAGCAFPALRIFALSGVGRGSLSPKLYHAAAPAEEEGDALGAPVARFLAATPSIEQLRLLDCYETLELPPPALPHLSAFRGSAIAAASVLPGRPLALRHTLHFALSGIVSARSSPLTLLPLVFYFRSFHGQNATRRADTSYIIPPSLQSLLAGLSPVLGAFPALRQLDLSPTAVDGIAKGNALEESALCTTWARACPALRSVVFPSRTEWRRDSLADVWVAEAGAAPVWTRY
ncbi:hypothetical protein FKP32DRAFT_1652488 [Trametes sanguinea]|nr:hypothetical protein FKP32DRAFT_1652488 [Trametes sanguinea]